MRARIHSFRTYDHHQGIEVLATLWTLHKGARTAVCVVRTSPLGWEVVATGARI